MILFKRVGESFRRIEGREWVLLGLETFGVVAGILIAFALNEWAGQRAAVQKQHELLERLFEESEMTVTGLRDDRDKFNGIVEAERAFATTLVHNNECPPEPMWQAVDTLPMYPSITVPSSVYQEIMGSGGLSGITNTDVRHSVSNFHRQLAWYQKQNDYFRDHLNYPISIGDKEVTYDLDVSKDEPQVSHYDRNALCSDHKFRNGIVDTVRNHIVIAEYHSDLARAGIFMCARIGAALGKPCVPADGALSGSDAEAARIALSPKETHPPS
jgi:hypothetical protein